MIASTLCSSAVRPAKRSYPRPCLHNKTSGLACTSLMYVTRHLRLTDFRYCLFCVARLHRQMLHMLPCVCALPIFDIAYSASQGNTLCCHSKIITVACGSTFHYSEREGGLDGSINFAGVDLTSSLILRQYKPRNEVLTVSEL